jgi:hypothetical protein
MQLRNHVHEIAVDMWPRCSQVEAEDGRIFYRLAKGRAYDLVEAYAKEPHIKFMNCDKDTDFEQFVREWGPLLLSLESLKRGWAVEQLRDYRAHSNFLRAVSRIMGACKGLQDERESLGEFLTAAVNMVALGPTREAMKKAVSLDLISEPLASLQQTGDPLKWANSASAGDIRKVLASCVEDWFRSPSRWGFRLQSRGRVFEIKPSFELKSLWDGLRWMLFFDEWNDHPPILCQECTTVFRPQTAHERKFCSPECAHRAANREWRRKDLHKQKLNRKWKGDTDVTRKTR